MKFLKILLLLSTTLTSVNYLTAQELGQQSETAIKAAEPTTGPHDATIQPPTTTATIQSPTVTVVSQANYKTVSQANYEKELPFYKESEHFAFYCDPVDQPTIDTMSEKFESFFNKVSADFHHNCTSKLVFKIYPNITEFHNAIGAPNAPDYICGYMAKDESVEYSVSPNNPGSYHNFDSIISSNLCGLVGLVIKDKYKNSSLKPSWLYLGICLYKSSRYDDNFDKFLAQNIQNLPTLQQLAQAYDNVPEFEKLEGWYVSYSIAKFIDKKYGFEKLLALLENDNSTQLVLGLSEENFRAQWIGYLVKEYGHKGLSAKS